MKKTNRNRMYPYWYAAIFFCLLLTLFSLIFVSCRARGSEDPELSATADVTANPDATGSIANPDASTPPTDPNGTENPQGIETEPPTPESTTPPPTTLEETEDMGDEYWSSITFLGDSTTHGLEVAGFVEKRQVWLPDNKTLTLGRHNIDKIVDPETGEEMFLRDIAALRKPELMVITLGVNGISFLTENGFKAEYTDLLETIMEASPDTKIIINTIYPIANSWKYQQDINNNKIDAANGWLLSIAETVGVRYMCSNTVLKNEYGILAENAHGGDGLHLNSASFEKVVKYIRTHGYR